MASGGLQFSGLAVWLDEAFEVSYVSDKFSKSEKRSSMVFKPLAKVGLPPPCSSTGWAATALQHPRGGLPCLAAPTGWPPQPSSTHKLAKPREPCNTHGTCCMACNPLWVRCHSPLLLTLGALPQPAGPQHSQYMIKCLGSCDQCLKCGKY